MSSTLVSVVLLQAMSRTVNSGQGHLKQKRKNIVGPEWELVCEHLKGTGSMLHHSRDTVHILLTVNLSCAPESDIHPGYNVNCTPWNWARWPSDPGKHPFCRFPEIITGCLKWAVEVSNYQTGRDPNHCDFEF